ncbi:MAG: sugar transferase [Planctomycetes bacterium]|nr:sugar transferase [Planctomycetota bacterium]
MSPELESLLEAQTAQTQPRPRAVRACGTDWEQLAPRGFYARHGRRLLDATLLALCLFPVGLLIGVVGLCNLAYFRDPRKVFFVQERVGERGRKFRIFKFRTMHTPRFSAHESWVHGYDRERVTWLGRFLRSTHLDELPQLLNVLRGEMTFIGPRPEMVEIEAWASEHIEGFSKRLALRPGITGYAQITQGYTGHSIEAYSEKLDLNERYRAGYSFALDLEILARTVGWTLRGRGWNWKLHSVAWKLRSSALRARNKRLRREIGAKATRLAAKHPAPSRMPARLR